MREDEKNDPLGWFVIRSWSNVNLSLSSGWGARRVQSEIPGCWCFAARAVWPALVPSQWSYLQSRWLVTRSYLRKAGASISLFIGYGHNRWCDSLPIWIDAAVACWVLSWVRLGRQYSSTSPLHLSVIKGCEPGLLKKSCFPGSLEDEDNVSIPTSSLSISIC